MKLSVNQSPKLRLVAPVFLVLHALSATAQPLLTFQNGVQIGWPTKTNDTYRPQWSLNPAGAWTDFGAPIPGDGTTNLLFDPVASGIRLYQALEIVPGSPPTPSLPLNPGFEFGNGVTASNWVVTQSGGSLGYAVRTNATPHGGSFCFEARLATTGPGQVVEFSQSGMPVTGGTNYPLSFYANALTGSQGQALQWRVLWNAGGDTGYISYNAGNNVYNFISNSIVAPAAATSATIFFHFAGAAITNQSATIRLDDITFGAAGGPGGPGQTNVLPVISQPFAQISFPSGSGVQYQPETTTDLALGSWGNLSSLITGDGSTKSVLVPMTNQSAYFRLRIPNTSTGIVRLFDAGTVLEPPTSIVTSNALITYLADRARDRHARESNFHLYDHYLSWYWEQRVANVEIIDHIGRGGTNITFRYTTQAQLNPAEFRTFFRGINTVAEYSDNAQATLVSTNASTISGETDFHYTADVNWNFQYNRPLQSDDRVEIEISQFLLTPRHGRDNYYGTVLLYVVGRGIVPWAEGQDLGLDGGVIGNVNQSLDSYPLPTNAWVGGQTTLPYQYSAEPLHRFKQTAGNISPTNGATFMLGRRLHHTDFGDGSHSEPDNPSFTEQAGKLGPKFVNRSCVACHVNNGRALPPAIGAPMLQSVVKVGSDAGGSPHPTLGSVLQPQSVTGPGEGGATIASYATNTAQYGDGTPYSLIKPNYSFSAVTPDYFSIRLAPQLVGLGLLEAVSEDVILALADPVDADHNGISGRIQIVTDPETGQPRLGRFNYRAGKARLSHQIAGALNNDMGVTTPVFPNLDGEAGSGTIEISAAELDKMTRYVALLGVAARRDLSNSQVLQGEQLFASANCVKCHSPTLTTSPFHPMTELRNQTIHPYTDLLLHDMGAGLADNMGEGVAAGSEWRTPPLWSIGFTAAVSGGEAYLHDGRARNLEEAILWHGGEAEASKEAFRSMSSAERLALVKFLQSL